MIFEQKKDSRCCQPTTYAAPLFYYFHKRDARKTPKLVECGPPHVKYANIRVSENKYEANILEFGLLDWGELIYKDWRD